MFTKSLVAGLLSVFVMGAYAETPAAPAAAAAKTPAAEPAAAKPASAPAAAAKPAAAATAPAAAATEPEVKKSKANICHDKTSPGYKQTKNFTAYATMDACTKSGGRAPKK